MGRRMRAMCPACGKHGPVDMHLHPKHKSRTVASYNCGVFKASLERIKTLRLQRILKNRKKRHPPPVKLCMIDACVSDAVSGAKLCAQHLLCGADDALLTPPLFIIECDATHQRL